MQVLENNMRYKNWETVFNHIAKLYPYPKAIVTYEGPNAVGITQIITKGNPPIMYQQPKIVIQGIYDPMIDQWQFFNAATGKKTDINNLLH